MLEYAKGLIQRDGDCRHFAARRQGCLPVSLTPCHPRDNTYNPLNVKTIGRFYVGV